MDNDLIITFINRHSELTYNGIFDNQRGEYYSKHRADLLNAIQEIITCIDWINNIYKSGYGYVKYLDSYELKHTVEKYSSEYVSNGSFITAALIMGERHKNYGMNILLPFDRYFLNMYKNQHFGGF